MKAVYWAIATRSARRSAGVKRRNSFNSTAGAGRRSRRSAPDRTPPADEFPELGLPDHDHAMPLGGEALDLHQLESAVLARHLQRIRPAAHENVRPGSWTRLADRPGAPGCSARVPARPIQESRERDPLSLETLDLAFAELFRRILQRLDHFPGGLIAFAARAEAAMDHFFEMIAAGEPADVATVHGAVHVAAEQHGDELADLIHVVALLPLADFPPGDFGGSAQRVERIGGHAAAARLMRRDAEVAELQALVLADEDVEGREVAMQRVLVGSMCTKRSNTRSARGWRASSSAKYASRSQPVSR